MLSLTSIITRNPQHFCTGLGDELVLMHGRSGQVFEISDNAKVIWNELSQPLTFAVLVDRVMAEFDVDRDVCINDMSQFLGELEEIGLIEIA